MNQEGRDNGQPSSFNDKSMIPCVVIKQHWYWVVVVSMVASNMTHIRIWETNNVCGIIGTVNMQFCSKSMCKPICIWGLLVESTNYLQTLLLQYLKLCNHALGEVWWLHSWWTN